MQVSAWEEGRAGGSRSSIITMQIVGEGRSAAGRLRNSSKLKYLLRLVNLGSRVTAGGMQVAGTLKPEVWRLELTSSPEMSSRVFSSSSSMLSGCGSLPLRIQLHSSCTWSLLALMGHGSYVTILQWRK